MELFRYRAEENILTKETLMIIEQEVDKAIIPMLYDEPLSAEYCRDIETDYKTSQYLFLDWLHQMNSFQTILYAGSGSDGLPKLVFGENKVIHTSMESYMIDESKYFPNLGNGIKIVADNRKLPFPDSSVDLILFFGFSIESTASQLKEAARVLESGGCIAYDNIVATDIDPLIVFPGFNSVTVPERFQAKGCSETSFSVFRKPKFYPDPI
jgi:hypothetical protein